MNIKYVNVVLDKEMFMDKMRNICVPKVKLPREPEVNIRNLMIRFNLAIFMVCFNITYNITECVNGTLALSDILMLLAWSVALILWSIEYRNARNAKVMNTAANAIESITNSELNKLWDTYSYDSAVHDKMFATINSTCKLLWIIYNTNLLSITTEDNKTLSVKYECSGNVYDDTLNADMLICEDNPNSVSIVKDGIILSNHSSVVPHALLSKTLG